MGDSPVRWEEFWVEDFRCVGSREVPGFGGGIEDLGSRVFVDGEVVNGFVGRGTAVLRVEVRLGEHGHYGFSVGFC